MTRLSMTCCARCIAQLRFVALLERRTASDAWLVAARDFTSSCSCASRRRASSSDSTFFCASMAPMNSLPACRARRGARRIARSAAHFVLRGLHRGVGLDLDDFLLGLVELGLRLLERVLLIGRIELDDRRRRT